MIEARTNPEDPNRARTSGWTLFCIALLISGFLLSCDSGGSETEGTTSAPDAAEQEASSSAAEATAVSLVEQVAGLYEKLPSSAPNPDNPVTDAKADLGRMLYYDARLSKNHDISCNSCHQLDAFGVDGEPTSPGHRGQRGGRNSPTVYNAALHVAQFWDGRASDVEAQAKGPVLNPIEMASPSEEHVVAVLRSIPGYAPAFAAAFPESDDPISYDNMARAIGAFERKLMTPGRFDEFLDGDATALDEQERRGLATFLSVGCNTCHTGPAIGGELYRKLGFIFPYETADPGREEVTGLEADRHQFKVPSLRNVAETGPYFHDGSIATLEEAVRIMAYHQAGQELEADQIADVVAFLGSLTGEVDVAYVTPPELPASGPTTPAPDPN
jgi:cytochrome c peroxidase